MQIMLLGSLNSRILNAVLPALQQPKTRFLDVFVANLQQKHYKKNANLATTSTLHSNVMIEHNPQNYSHSSAIWASTLLCFSKSTLFPAMAKLISAPSIFLSSLTQFLTFWKLS